MVINGVHVNGFMIGGRDETAIEKVKENLKTRYEIKDLGEGENILGLWIQWYKRIIN